MPKPQLIELRKHLLNNLGLNFTESREEELYKKIGFAAKEFNYKNTNAFINWIANNNLNPNQIEKLAAFLTIGETYFLREIKALDYLEHTYLPDLIYKRRGKNQRLRIWCAGCSSGEEPYSIAIILKKVIPDIKNWNITILATDINATFLEKARTGIYTKWSFRGIPESFKTENFKEFGKDKFQINPEIQRMVTFSYQNLAKDTYPSLVNNTNAMDIILCRNVLIYFSDKGIKQVTTRLYNCLTKEGILVVSPVEMSNLISPKFSRIQHNGITIYKKDSRKVKHKEIIELGIPETIEISRAYQQHPKLEINKPEVEPTNTILEKNVQKNKIQEAQAKEEVSEYDQAVVLFELGKFEEAENLLTNILTRNSINSIAAISLLVKTKANLGKLDSAEILCKKALQINKLDASLYYLMATIQQEQGKNSDAISSLNRAIYLEPDFSLAHFSLGNLCTKSGKNNAGLKHYKNTLNILATHDPNRMLMESDGITAGRLTEIIRTMKE